MVGAGMTELGKDAGLVRVLNERGAIRDARMVRFSVYEKQYSVNAEVELAPQGGQSADHVLLVFSEVREYGFYYNAKQIFYNVENFKFSYSNSSGAYLSLDPDESKSAPSQNDQDFIAAKSVAGYLLPPAA